MDKAQFLKFHQEGPFTLVDPTRSWCLYQAAISCRDLTGEYWECGVYGGGSALVLDAARQGQTLRLFDTFSGLPEEGEGMLKGAYAQGLGTVARNLEGLTNVSFHVGRVPQTFTGLMSQIAFAHLDMDLYASTKAGIERVYPMLVHGGCIVFDDWHWPACPGVTQAIENYLANCRGYNLVETVPAGAGPGQCLVRKVG